MTEIRVPKLNNNDTEYTLIEWIAAPGSLVRAGDPVATVETSKAAEELPSAGEGYLRQLLSVGSSCAVGAVIGLLESSPASPASASCSSASRAPDVSDTSDIVITEPALRVMAERGISRADVEALGRKVIRVADLEAPPADERLPAVQRAVAAVVTESLAIPQAYVALRVPVDPAVGRELSRKYHRMIGLVELTVAAIGAAAAEHPDCFAAFVPPDRVRRHTAVDVGVTVDVGRGLHVPVIRDVPALTVADIAGRLMELRATALRGQFRPADLDAPAILLALHTDPDVTAAVPLVLPGTTCAVSLTARVGGHVALGLAYDHRVINGRGATLFLKAVAARLAS
ncbi:2-oxo acid dehydrogenase subunit E2 [Dactylosporangium matsuzakiense]|uniref:Dihydrolipoamide acetyltransferase component of pyruvate dehydrogenase complex n=1 Tax=Dactylosporangium matsuzakiense TaxID=53360 RepID=A0A9W6KJZ0_9ACTN|nr:2-oxo acid dehydrogenase subunit E2 [Dactylosporangium matsuzakiense]UWZ45928.1 2-oxo acid dehydrogenase subunit E2 [Dactylosporangium matsuzakiense]GLL02903.1 dihydrolipoamide acetyltransferase component of pyruvate dehydrogenase complex [Dactylosporangium matsuzakiense]